jgi:hypothetical protein
MSKNRLRFQHLNLDSAMPPCILLSNRRACSGACTAAKRDSRFAI